MMVKGTKSVTYLMNDGQTDRGKETKKIFLQLVSLELKKKFSLKEKAAAESYSKWPLQNLGPKGSYTGSKKVSSSFLMSHDS